MTHILLTYSYIRNIHTLVNIFESSALRMHNKPMYVCMYVSIVIYYIGDQLLLH